MPTAVEDKALCTNVQRAHILRFQTQRSDWRYRSYLQLKHQICSQKQQAAICDEPAGHISGTNGLCFVTCCATRARMTHVHTPIVSALHLPNRSANTVPYYSADTVRHSLPPTHESPSRPHPLYYRVCSCRPCKQNPLHSSVINSGDACLSNVCINPRASSQGQHT